MKFIKTFQKKWRQKGKQTYIYLDDVDSGTHPHNAPKASQSCGGRFVGSRNQIESQRKQIATILVCRTFKISNQFATRKIKNNPQKSKDQKKSWENLSKGKHFKETSGSNLRPVKVKFGRYAFLKGIHRTFSKVFGRNSFPPLGFKTPNTIPP